MHSETAPLLEHFGPAARPEVARWFVLVITSYGPPICHKPSQMVSRVSREAPAEISKVVKAHPKESLRAASFWLMWWESMAPSCGRRV